jgi:hypothetical protein
LSAAIFESTSRLAITFCPLDHRCMKGLSPERVFSTMTDVIGSRDPRIPDPEPRIPRPDSRIPDPAA